MITESDNKIDLGHTKLFLLSDGIIQVNGSDHKYSIADIVEIRKAAVELTLNGEIFLLLVGSEYTEVDQEAMNYMSLPSFVPNSKAMAFVIKSLAQRIILNFVINVKGTSVPAKFFTKKKEALNWLKENKY